MRELLESVQQPRDAHFPYTGREAGSASTGKYMAMVHTPDTEQAQSRVLAKCVVT
jgi:hypothetical protein